MFCPRCQRQYPAGYCFCPYDGERTSEAPSLEQLGAQPTRMSDGALGERYRVRGFIGKGGMARVYLAEDLERGEPVAVKVLEPGYARDPAARERFLREARAVSRIDHPNIIRILATGERESDGAPYLVMEYLFGESLGQWLDREGVLPREIALPALRQAASALAAAHAEGVVHRDVKPDNLFLVGEPGDPYDLKVLDFGLSKLQSSQHTAAGIIMGTPRYMAPEQALAEGVDARSDVYGLGMVMYRAFAGCCPFDDMDDVQTLAHQLHSPPMPPSQVVPELDGQIEAVILTAIRKRPENRYPTMAAMCLDLERLEQGLAPEGARAVAGDVYEPKTKMGRLIAQSIGRMIGLRFDE